MTDQLLAQFRNLSNSEKSEFVDQFLQHLGPDQKWQLQQRLPQFLFRDFFTLLPDEVLEVSSVKFCEIASTTMLMITADGVELPGLPYAAASPPSVHPLAVTPVPIPVRVAASGNPVGWCGRLTRGW